MGKGRWLGRCRRGARGRGTPAAGHPRGWLRAAWGCRRAALLSCRLKQATPSSHPPTHTPTDTTPSNLVKVLDYLGLWRAPLLILLPQLLNLLACNPAAAAGRQATWPGAGSRRESPNRRPRSAAAASIHTPTDIYTHLHTSIHTVHAQTRTNTHTLPHANPPASVSAPSVSLMLRMASASRRCFSSSLTPHVGVMSPTMPAGGGHSAARGGELMSAWVGAVHAGVGKHAATTLHACTGLLTLCQVVYQGQLGAPACRAAAVSGSQAPPLLLLAARSAPPGPRHLACGSRSSCPGAARPSGPYGTCGRRCSRGPRSLA